MTNEGTITGMIKAPVAEAILFFRNTLRFISVVMICIDFNFQVPNLAEFIKQNEKGRKISSFLLSRLIFFKYHPQAE